MMADTFGKVLTELRESCGLSFRALAIRAGCDHATVMKLEAGQRQPTVEMVGMLANGLDLAEGGDRRDRLYIAAGYVPSGISADAMARACRAARRAS